MSEPKKERNGTLSIPMPFADAIKAALEVKPAQKPPQRPRKATKKP